MDKGFTLIEVVVAVGILILILQLVAGSYAHFVSVQRDGIHEQEMQEDVRLVLQLFNREARTGYGTTYKTIVNPNPGVVFRNQENDCVKYELISSGPLDSSLWRSDTEGNGTDPTADCSDTAIYTKSARRLTDKKSTIITKLEFVAHPAKISSPPLPPQLTEQGFITVHLEVTSPPLPAPPATPEPVILQSTVTSRQFIPY